MAQVLLADDDASIGSMIIGGLTECGHSVAMVDNGAQVLSVSLQNPPDLIILDNLMPGLKGTEVLWNLQIYEVTAGIPVIMLTGQTEPIHMIEAYRAGASDYMTKPFELENLIARVALVLKNVQKSPALDCPN